MISDRVCAHALASVGLGADKAHLAAFCSYLGGPNERPEIALAMATYRDPKTGHFSSTCGLAVRAALREAGVADQRIAGSYAPRIGRVFGDLRDVGAEHGALLTLGPDDNPLELVDDGDVVMVDGDKPDGHTFIAVEKTDDGRITVDGGETLRASDGVAAEDIGKQCIRRRRKRWTRGVHGFWYDQADDGGPSRRITHVIKTARLEAAPAPCTSTPSGAELVDVSDQNGRLDFGAIAAAGVIGTIVRASFGRVDGPRDIDTRMREHANASRRSIRELTAYGLVLARHGQRQDADRQARDLLKLWHEIGSTLLPMGDFEREKGDERVTEQEYADAIEMWIDTMGAELGKLPLLYCGPGWWDSSPLRRALSRAGECPLVCSDFEASRPIGSPLLPTPWKARGAALHQYAGSPTATGRTGRIPGVAAPIDRLRALGPIDAIRI